MKLRLVIMVLNLTYGPHHIKLLMSIDFDMTYIIGFGFVDV